MTKKDETQLIETVDDQGNKITFELFDIVEFEEKEYALLIPKQEGEEELVLMRFVEEGDDYVFQAIDDDKEFERVSEFIEKMVDEAE